MLAIQDLFNKIYSHLLSQNARSELPEPIYDGLDTISCAYRGTYGRMCAVGCLIEPKHYHLELEGTGFDHPKLLSALFLSGVDIHDKKIKNLLKEVQEIHDLGDISDWKKELNQVAISYGLNYEE